MSTINTISARIGLLTNNLFEVAKGAQSAMEDLLESIHVIKLYKLLYVIHIGILSIYAAAVAKHMTTMYQCWSLNDRCPEKLMAWYQMV